jgi:hypothetical protein
MPTGDPCSFGAIRFRHLQAVHPEIQPIRYRIAIRKSGHLQKPISNARLLNGSASAALILSRIAAPLGRKPDHPPGWRYGR